METETWQRAYHVRNQDVVALIRTWKSTTGVEHTNVENLLIKRLSYLVYKRIQGYKEQPYYDDVLQEGIIGLIQAFTKFDPLKGPNFFKIAKWYISTRVRNFLKENNKFYGEGREVLTDKLDHFLSTEDTIEQKFEKLQEYQLIREAIAKLPDIEQSVIYLRFGIGDDDPQTMQQIGEKFSVSRQRIDQIQSSALRKVRKMIENMNE